MAITVTIQGARAQALLRSVHTPDGLKRLAVIGGRAVANRLRDHFLALQQARPNKQGFPRSNFWAAARRSVQNPQPSGAATVTVAINHVGVALRRFGGVVRPRTARMLTLPATAEAYNKRAKEFSNLRFAFALDEDGNRRPALVEAENSPVRFGRPRKDGSRRVDRGVTRGGQVFYWLVRQTKHTADPSVLPTDAQMAQAAVAAITETQQRDLARAGGGQV